MQLRPDIRQALTQVPGLSPDRIEQLARKYEASQLAEEEKAGLVPLIVWAMVQARMPRDVAQLVLRNLEAARAGVPGEF